MKKREGFVSNSSSSSFIIGKSDLTDTQIEKIKNHSKIGKDNQMKYYDSVWSIDETPDLIKGYTSMDNFDMSEFLSMIGVDEDKIHWGE